MYYYNYQNWSKQHIDFLRFLFTEDSLKIKKKNLKEPGTILQVAVFVDFFDKIFSFAIRHKLFKFH